jgi:hypothetical protein
VVIPIQGLSPIREESDTEDNDDDDDDSDHKQQIEEEEEEEEESLAFAVSSSSASSSSSSSSISTSAMKTSTMLDTLLESFLLQLQELLSRKGASSISRHHDDDVRQQQSQSLPPQQQQRLKKMRQSVRLVMCQHEDQHQDDQLLRPIMDYEQDAPSDKNKNNNSTKVLRLAEMENEWLWSVMMPAMAHQLFEAHTQTERSQAHLNALKQVLALDRAEQGQRRGIDKRNLTLATGETNINDSSDDDCKIKSRGDDQRREKARTARRCSWSWWKSLFGRRMNHQRH